MRVLKANENPAQSVTVIFFQALGSGAGKNIQGIVEDRLNGHFTKV